MDEVPPEDDGFSVDALIHGAYDGWVSNPREEIQSSTAVEEEHLEMESGGLDHTIHNNHQDGPHENDIDIDHLEPIQAYLDKLAVAQKEQKSENGSKEESPRPPSLDTPDPHPTPTQADTALDSQPPEPEQEIADNPQTLLPPRPSDLGLPLGIASAWSDSSSSNDSDSDSDKADEEEDDLPPYKCPSPEEIRMALVRKGHDVRLMDASHPFFITPCVAPKLVPSLRRIAGLERGEKPTARTAKGTAKPRHSLLNPNVVAERLVEKKKKVKVIDEMDGEWSQLIRRGRANKEGKGDASKSEDPIDQAQFDGFDEAFKVDESSDDAETIPSFRPSQRATSEAQEIPLNLFPDPHEPLTPPHRYGGIGNNLEALRENFFRANPTYLSRMTNQVLQNASPLTRSVILHWHAKVGRRNEALRQVEAKLQKAHDLKQSSKSKIVMLETQIHQLSDEIERLEDEKHAAAKKSEKAENAQANISTLENQVENSEKQLASAKEEYDNAVNALRQEKDEIQAALIQSRSDSDALVEQIQNLLELVELAKNEDKEALMTLREHNEHLQDDFNVAIKERDALRRDININKSQQVHFEAQANNVHYLEQELNRELQFRSHTVDRNKKLEEENQILNQELSLKAQELMNAKEWFERNEEIIIELFGQLDRHKTAVESSNKANKVLMKGLEKSHQRSNETEKLLFSRVQELKKEFGYRIPKEYKHGGPHYTELEKQNQELKPEATAIGSKLTIAEHKNRPLADKIWVPKMDGPVPGLLPLHKPQEGVPRLIKPRYACEYATQKRKAKLDRLRKEQIQILQEEMDRNKAIRVAREVELFIIFGWDPQNPPNSEKYQQERRKTAEQRWGLVA